MGILTNRPPGVSLETALAAWLSTLAATWLNKTLTSPTLTTPKVDSILDSNGNTILLLSPTASAANYFQLSNASGATLLLKLAGTATNLSMNLQAKGSSGLIRLLDGNGVSQFATKAAAASAVNYITVANAATAVAPTVAPDGTDTNIDLSLTGKGTGVVKANGARVITSTRSINPQTGTSYTLALTDAGGLVTLSNASAITLTVPPNASVAFPVGASIDLIELGAGQVTIAPGAGVTFQTAAAGLKIATQYGGAYLIKIATDTWIVTGNLSA